MRSREVFLKLFFMFLIFRVTRKLEFKFQTFGKIDEDVENCRHFLEQLLNAVSFNKKKFL